MSIVEQLQADYRRFPEDQSYHLYAADVFFKDPMTQFRGLERYQQMIQFIKTYFLNVQMELHDITQEGSRIHTRWTLAWQAPLPWKPHLVITGCSELQLNDAGLVSSHIDTWDCSRWSVLMQLFGR